MDKRESDPLAPTKPPEIDPELNATAATAVEQWRNYQQAYAAYQQQYAAYQQYIQQRQYAQTVEQQQMAYSQYLEQHSQYEYQLQQYEQHHQQRQNQEHQQQRPAAATDDAVPSWSAEAYAMQNPLMGPSPVHPAPGQMNGYVATPSTQEPTGSGDYVGTNPGYAKGRKRSRDHRSKYRSNEKKSELHSKTVLYVNPEDEILLPEDLKKLFKEFQCDLCRTRMNSHISANIHYQSKLHEKKITQWLKEYCAETGTTMLPRVRRQPELVAEVIAIAGQSVFHCEACDLPLTSVQHANQHYTGKRHAMVVNGKKLPSGNGYYNAEGKWIRAGNIIKEQSSDAPTDLNQSVVGSVRQNLTKRRRLEPPPVPPIELITGVNWLADPSPSTPTNSTAPQQSNVVPTVDATVPAPTAPVATESIGLSNESKPILTITVDSDDENPRLPPTVDIGGTSNAVVAAASVISFQAAPIIDSKPPTTTLEQEIRKKEGLDCMDESGTFCLICETSVTSRSEMLMHMKGAKHLKKARMKGMAVRTTPFNPNDTILKSLSKPVRKTDWSLYRMPSGKFYCKACNLIVADEKLFGQHWYGKKHKLKARQEQTGDQQQSPQPQQPVTSTENPANPAPVVNPFASDDIELNLAAYSTVGAIGNTNPHKLKSNKPPHKRFHRPFFLNKRYRTTNARKPFPVKN